MALFEYFTPYELGILTLMLVRILYHRHLFQRNLSRTQPLPSEPLQSPFSEPHQPPKTYISTRTQTTGIIVRKAYSGTAKYYGTPSDTIQFRKPTWDDGTDIEDEEQFDYFYSDKPTHQLTDIEQRLRLDLLIRTASELFAIRFQDDFPPPTAKKAVNAQSKGKWKQPVKKGWMETLKGRYVGELPEEREAKMRLITDAFVTLFDNGYNGKRKQMAVVGKWESDKQEVTLFAVHKSESSYSYDKLEEGCFGVKDDYGDRPEVPKTESVGVPKREGLELTMDGFVKSVVKTRWPRWSITPLHDKLEKHQLIRKFCNLYREVKKITDKELVREVFQQYVLLLSLTDIKFWMEMSIKIRHREKFSHNSFGSYCDKRVELRDILKESVPADLLGIQFDDEPAVKELESFNLDETTLRSCLELCEVKLDFNRSNRIILNRQSIQQFHLFFTRLLDLISENLENLGSKNLERKHGVKWHESEQIVSPVVEAIAKTQLYLRSLSNLVHHSRSFQIYLHQPAIKRALVPSDTTSLAKDLYFTDSETGSWTRSTEAMRTDKVLDDLKGVPASFAELKANPIGSFISWIKQITKQFHASETLLKTLDRELNITIIHNPPVKPDGQQAPFSILCAAAADLPLNNRKEANFLSCRVEKMDIRLNPRPKRDHLPDDRNCVYQISPTFHYPYNAYHPHSILTNLLSLPPSHIPSTLPPAARTSFTNLLISLSTTTTPHISTIHPPCRLCTHYSTLVLPSNPITWETGRMSHFIPPPWETRTTVLRRLWGEMKPRILTYMNEGKVLNKEEWDTIEEERNREMQAAREREKEIEEKRERKKELRKFDPEGEVRRGWKEEQEE